MGLRLEEALSLQVGDIDTRLKRVHIRRGKGHKDRLVPLPDLTFFFHDFYNSIVQTRTHKGIHWFLITSFVKS